MLEKLNVSKSPGPDGLHPKILYETTTPLKLIFEASLKLKELPHDWVNANISAVYKKAKFPNYAIIGQLVLRVFCAKTLLLVVFCMYCLYNFICILHCKWPFWPFCF